MRPIKKSRANAGETLVEVVASIFIFLILMGILQGAITYSSNSLKKNKEIRSDNAKIMEALQNTEVTSVEHNKSIDFNATNSSLSIQSSKNAVFSRLFAYLMFKPYVFSLVFALMSQNKGNFFILHRLLYPSALRNYASLPL